MIRDEDTLNILLDSIARSVRQGRLPNEAPLAETDTIPPATAAERFYRDARLFRIYEGTPQIEHIVVARNRIKAAQK